MAGTRQESMDRRGAIAHGAGILNAGLTQTPTPQKRKPATTSSNMRMTFMPQMRMGT